MYKQRSKAERRAWWRNLSPEQQQEYIERRQSQKAEQRKNSSYVPEVTGFEATGVNPDNRAEWRELVLERNQWLNSEIFVSHETAKVNHESVCG